MIKLKNILKLGEKIEMDCFIEGDEKDYFKLVINTQTFEILSCSRDGIKLYVGHVRYYIKKLIESGKEIPKTATVMWC